MTSQQFWTLLSACFVVFVALGFMLAIGGRAVLRRVSRWLPARHLRPVMIRVRKGSDA